MNPGDTAALPATFEVNIGRRPLNEGRRLNPGDTFPDRLGTAGSMTSVAQRRPEVEPRRHRSLRAYKDYSRRALNEGRRLNPGDTLDSRRIVHALNEGRRLNPGDTSIGVYSGSVEPLNEGRRLNPGDTRP